MTRLAAFHGAALVSLITFLPIYLRAVRGLSPSETGFMLLPLTAGIGIGSMATGQLVTRTGYTAPFPTYGLIGATAGASSCSPFFISYLFSAGQIAWAFGGVALFIEHVMGVVQVTVQTEIRPAASRHRRRHGAVLALGRRRLRHRNRLGGFVFHSHGDRSRHRESLFGMIIERGPEALVALDPGADTRRATPRSPTLFTPPF